MLLGSISNTTTLLCVYFNFPYNKDGLPWRIQRLIWAHREREARAWENQVGGRGGGSVSPAAGTGQSPVGGRGAKPPKNFDDLLVKITFLKLNMPFYET